MESQLADALPEYPDNDQALSDTLDQQLDRVRLDYMISSRIAQPIAERGTIPAIYSVLISSPF